MIRWIVRVGVALIILATLGGSLATSARADSDALNVDYVGWHLASNRPDVDKVELSFDANLTGKYEVTVELLDNDKNVVSSGKCLFRGLKKDDKLIIDLIDAPVTIVYYIRVTVKKLPDEDVAPPPGTTDVRGGMVVPPPEPGPPPEPEPEPEPTPTPVPAPPPGTTDVRGGIPLINWPVVGRIIAAAVVVGLLVFFLIRRKRKKKAH